MKHIKNIRIEEEVYIGDEDELSVDIDLDDPNYNIVLNIKDSTLHLSLEDWDTLKEMVDNQITFSNHINKNHERADN